jgi:hypothetical protein
MKKFLIYDSSDNTGHPYIDAWGLYNNVTNSLDEIDCFESEEKAQDYIDAVGCPDHLRIVIVPTVELWAFMAVEINDRLNNVHFDAGVDGISVTGQPEGDDMSVTYDDGKFCVVVTGYEETFETPEEVVDHAIFLANGHFRQMK